MRVAQFAVQFHTQSVEGAAALRAEVAAGRLTFDQAIESMEGPLAPVLQLRKENHKAAKRKQAQEREAAAAAQAAEAVGGDDDDDEFDM
eukprot:COSAG01_NODE_3526_length_5971_cov_13.245305_6_plen_89_part_00